MRLLILSCSNRKRSANTPILFPASERYDGPLFRVLRKARREGYGHDTLVLILSAEYGLIDEDTPIPLYDRRMTPARARELQKTVAPELEKYLHRYHFTHIFITLGQLYLTTITAAKLPPDTYYAHGGIGERAAQLKSWLRKGASL